MTQPGVNRRDFVLGLGSAAAGVWLTAHAAELGAVAAHAASATPQQPWEFFTPDQAREFDAISAQIVPTDDTPGAREAHVVRFADRYLATVGKDEQPRAQDAFKLLADTLTEKKPGSRSFAALDNADQIGFLTELEKAHRGAFNAFLTLTMLGMFSHPVHGGNFNKVGWKLVGFEDRYSWTQPFGYYDRV